MSAKPQRSGDDAPRQRTDHGEDTHFGKAYDLELLRRLWPFVWPFRRLFFAALLLMPLATALGLAQPYLVKKVIDDHLAAGRFEGLPFLALLYGLSLLLESAARFGQQYLMQLGGQHAVAELRGHIFEHVQRLHAGYFDRHPVGRIMTRVVNDVESLGELFSTGAVMVIADLITVAGIIGMMLWLDVKLTLAAFAVIPIIAGIVLALRPIARSAFRDIRQRLSRINGYLAENLSGMSVVQLFRREARNLKDFDDLNREYRDANYRAIFADASIYALVEALASVATACIVYFGGGATIQEAVQIGTLVAFIEYAGRFFVPIRDLSAKYTILQAAMASAERIFELVDTEPEIRSPSAPADAPRFEQSLRFEGVRLAYNADTEVLRGVDLEIPRGQRVAVVGATGAGKTSLIRLLNRSYEVSAGQVSIDGVDIRDMRLEDLRALVTVVQQDAVLFSGSIEHNITLGDPSIDAVGVRRAARNVGLNKVLDRLDAGLAHEVHEGGGNLSAGERQIICFARALARDPQLLILDEATSSVDPASEHLILEATEALLEGRTAIVIAHRLTTIRMVDRVIVMHQGRVAEDGTHEELLARGGLYAQLYEIQLQRDGAA